MYKYVLVKNAKSIPDAKKAFEELVSNVMRI